MMMMVRDELQLSAVYVRVLEQRQEQKKKEEDVCSTICIIAGLFWD